MARPRGQLLSARRKRPLRTHRRFGWGWIRRLPLTWFGALAVCAFLVYFFAGSGNFSVHTVQASANLTPADVQVITARCGCIGANIFVVRPDDIKRRLEEIPTLVVRRVYTRLPNMVIVDAYYRRKIAVWRTPEAAYGVAADGEVLQVWKLPFARGVWKGLPVFEEGYDDTFRRGHRLLVGDHIPLDPLAAALSLRARLPDSLRSQVTHITYRRFVGLTLRSRGGWWALFDLDRSAQLDERIVALQTALQPDASGKRPPLGPGRCIDLRGAWPVLRADHLCGA